MIDFNWAYIGTVAGAAFAVTLIIEVAKLISKSDLNKWWIRLLTYVVGVVLLDVALAFVGWDWSTFALNFINGLLVYLVATGEYETIIKTIKAKIPKDKV